MIVTYNELHVSSRVWIFQADRELTDEQVIEGDLLIRQFLESWTSHNQSLPAYGSIRFNRFIILIVDQSYVSAGGCSQDKMVHFIEALEQHWKVSLLGRKKVAYKNRLDDKIITLELEDLKDAFSQGIIHSETMVFDNLVDTKEKFESLWLKKLPESWHKRFL